MRGLCIARVSMKKVNDHMSSQKVNGPMSKMRIGRSLRPSGLDSTRL